MTFSKPTFGPDAPDWHSNVEAALLVGSADEIDWDDAADLVVVGFGGAGVAAALQAIELGGSVIALDRFHGGGATKASGGVLYAGGGTHIQREAGVEDSPDAMFDYLRMETGGIVPDEVLRAFCDESPQTVDWLTGHGVPFKGALYSRKTSYPGVEHFLYHSDNSLIAPYCEKTPPAARGHRCVAPPQDAIRATNLGGPIFDPLRKAFAAAGGRVFEQAEARQLVIDGKGAVLGVRSLEFDRGAPEAARHRALLAKAAKIQATWLPIIPGSSFFLRRAEKMIEKARALEVAHRHTRFYRARKGVILSAGGFIFNRAMVKAHAPKFADAFPLGTTGDQGDGVRLGQTAGGVVGNMDRASAWRFINPPMAWSQGIVVNCDGERFVNESSYGAAIGTAIALDQDGEAWSIVDKTLAKESLAQVGGGDVLPFQRDLARLNFWFAAKKASDLPALAAKTGLPPDALMRTVEAYNANAGKHGDAFHKSPQDVRALTKPPFYAINISIGATLFPCPAITLGGLLVDGGTGAVQNAEGGVIRGLYAAGRTAVGVCSWNYLSGLSIADCIFSGRRAARHAIAG